MATASLVLACAPAPDPKTWLRSVVDTFLGPEPDGERLAEFLRERLGGRRWEEYAPQLVPAWRDAQGLLEGLGLPRVLLPSGLPVTLDILQLGDVAPVLNPGGHILLEICASSATLRQEFPPRWSDLPDCYSRLLLELGGLYGFGGANGEGLRDLGDAARWGPAVVRQPLSEHAFPFMVIRDPDPNLTAPEMRDLAGGARLLAFYNDLGWAQSYREFCRVSGRPDATQAGMLQGE